MTHWLDMTDDPPRLLREVHDFMSATKTFETAEDASFTLMIDPLYVAPPGPFDTRLGDSIKPSPTPTPSVTPSPGSSPAVKRKWLL